MTQMDGLVGMHSNMHLRVPQRCSGCAAKKRSRQLDAERMSFPVLSWEGLIYGCTQNDGSTVRPRAVFLSRSTVSIWSPMRWDTPLAMSTPSALVLVLCRSWCNRHLELERALQIQKSQRLTCALSNDALRVNSSCGTVLGRLAFVYIVFARGTEDPSRCSVVSRGGNGS